MNSVVPSYSEFLAALLQLWPLWALFGAILVFQIVVAIYKQRRLARSGIADIDKMTGAMFEQYLELLFRNHRYGVERTGKAGDYGAGLVISKDGKRTIVQAKRYSKKKVNLKAVQEAVAAKAMYRSSEAMVVTNRSFAKSAYELARVNDVELWNRDRLISMILSGQRKAQKGFETGEEHNGSGSAVGEVG